MIESISRRQSVLQHFYCAISIWPLSHDSKITD